MAEFEAEVAAGGEGDGEGDTQELLEGQLEDYHKRKEEVASKTVQIRRKLDSLRRLAEVSRENLESNQAEARQLQASKAELIGKIAQTEARVGKVELYLTANERKVGELQAQLDTVRAEIAANAEKQAAVLKKLKVSARGRGT